MVYGLGFHHSILEEVRRCTADVWEDASPLTPQISSNPKVPKASAGRGNGKVGAVPRKGGPVARLRKM